MAKFTSFLYRSFQTLWAAFPFKKSFLLLLKNLKISPGKYRNDLWFEGIFTVELDEIRFRLHATKKDHSTLSLFWTRLEESWDAISIQVWKKLSENAEGILDVGANIGLYSMVAKCTNPKSSVIAFEPSILAFKKLQKNVSLNHLGIQTEQIALSNFNGESEFYDLDTPTAIGSLKENENLKENDNLRSYKVKVESLHSYASRTKLERIDLISIDVEMNEVEVLKGMGELLLDFKPNFIIEILNEEMGIKLHPFFEKKNYEFYQIDESKGLIQVESLNKVPQRKKSQGYNFLVIQKSHVDHVRSYILNS